MHRYMVKTLGLTLVAISLIGLLWLYIPVAYYQAKYFVRQSWFALIDSTGRFRHELGNPVWQAKGDYEIFIPKIDARAPVIPDVNANDEKAYFVALKRGVAAVSGLAVPGRRGTTYIFAHSTDNPLNFSRYNAVFYLLNKMEKGDRVELFYRGNYYHYRVDGVQILPAENVHFLTPQFQQELLVLQTCYPPGTTQKRLLVIAKRIQ